MRIPLPKQGLRATVYDSELPRLALRLTAKGVRSFYVIKRTGSTVSWIKLGTFPDMTVEQARAAALKVLGEFASGADPAATRRALKAEPTFGEVFEQFLPRKRKKDGTSLSPRTKRDYQDIVRLYLGSIHTKKPSKITKQDVKGIHAKVSRISLSQADRALAVISSVFNFAIDQLEVCSENPASRVQKNPAPSRDRFASSAELPYLIDAIGESALADYFLISLLTGARRANVQAMTWTDIDLDAGIWRIDLTKNGSPQNLPLSPEAVRVLKARKSRQPRSSYVFPGSGKTGHLVEPKKAWATLLQKASLRRLLNTLSQDAHLNEEAIVKAMAMINDKPSEADKTLSELAVKLNVDKAAYDMCDLRIHDLRRTLGSWQAKTGASLAIIGRSLNHKTQQATAIYARLDLDPVRQSINTATKAMLEAAGQKPKNALIQLTTDTKLD